MTREQSKVEYALTPMLLVILQCSYYCGTIGGIVQVRGAGASFPYNVYKSWILSYKASQHGHGSLNMQYEITGSTEGKRRIIANENIEYAASDKPLTDEELESHPDLFMFPTMAG